MRTFLAKILIKLLILLSKYNIIAKHIVLTEAVKDLFNTISADDILRFEKDGSIKFEDKTLPSVYKKDLQEQAKLLPNLMLWRIIKKDIQYQLNKKMFQESKITEDLLWGKLILWLYDCMETRIKQLSDSGR